MIHNPIELWETTNDIPRNNNHLLRFCEEHHMRDNCHEARFAATHEALHIRFAAMRETSVRTRLYTRPHCRHQLAQIPLLTRLRIFVTKPWDWN